MVGRRGVRGSGISVLAARHEDDDIYIYIYRERERGGERKREIVDLVDPTRCEKNK